MAGEKSHNTPSVTHKYTQYSLIDYKCFLITINKKHTNRMKQLYFYLKVTDKYSFLSSPLFVQHTHKHSPIKIVSSKKKLFFQTKPPPIHHQSSPQSANQDTPKKKSQNKHNRHLSHYSPKLKICFSLPNLCHPPPQIRAIF